MLVAADLTLACHNISTIGPFKFNAGLVSYWLIHADSESKLKRLKFEIEI